MISGSVRGILLGGRGRSIMIQVTALVATAVMWGAREALTTGSQGFLRPAAKRRPALRGQSIDPTPDPLEPAVDIVQQDLGCPRARRAQFQGAPRPFAQRSRTRQRLLPVGGHDRDFRGAAERWIAEPAAMLVEKPRAAFGVAARPPWPRLDQDFDPAAARHAKQPKAQETAQLAHT